MAHQGPSRTKGLPLQPPCHAAPRYRVPARPSPCVLAAPPSPSRIDPGTSHGQEGPRSPHFLPLAHPGLADRAFSCTLQGPPSQRSARC